jgi:hypothetical protein
MMIFNLAMADAPLTALEDVVQAGHPDRSDLTEKKLSILDHLADFRLSGGTLNADQQIALAELARMAVKELRKRRGNA